MGVPVYRTASTVPQYTDTSVYRYTPSRERANRSNFKCGLTVTDQTPVPMRFLITLANRYFLIAEFMLKVKKNDIFHSTHT